MFFPLTFFHARPEVRKKNFAQEPFYRIDRRQSRPHACQRQGLLYEGELTIEKNFGHI
jgi:hypothetical protein